MTRNGSRRRSGQGTSLIEVIVALGLLLIMLNSLIVLFVIGARQVKSGRTSSEALAVAQTVLEEMQGWGFHQTHTEYGLSGTASSYSVDTRTNSYASRWQQTLDSKLLNAYAIIDLESLGPGGPPPPMATTRAIRLIVTVHWDEGDRHRTVRLGSVRM